MATPDQITEVRLRTDETDVSSSPYSDEQIGTWIDEDEDLHKTTSRVWQYKAARYSALVNTTESGSSRSLSDLMAHALAMAKQPGGVDTPPYSRPSRTRSIERL